MNNLTNPRRGLKRHPRASAWACFPESRILVTNPQCSEEVRNVAHALSTVQNNVPETRMQPINPQCPEEVRNVTHALVNTKYIVPDTSIHTINQFIMPRGGPKCHPRPRNSLCSPRHAYFYPAKPRKGPKRKHFMPNVEPSTDPGGCRRVRAAAATESSALA